jgi:hypothetical protein
MAWFGTQRLAVAVILTPTVSQWDDVIHNQVRPDTPAHSAGIAIPKEDPLPDLG